MTRASKILDLRPAFRAASDPQHLSRCPIQSMGMNVITQCKWRIY